MKEQNPVGFLPPGFLLFTVPNFKDYISTRSLHVCNPSFGKHKIIIYKFSLLFLN